LSKLANSFNWVR